MVGWRSLLTKLSSYELAEVKRQCSPKLPQNSVTDRIVGGQPVNIEDMTFAAVFVYAPPYKPATVCSAVIISPRHILTARHCFSAGSAEEYQLWVGGQCHIQNLDCPSGPDMIRVEYEFAIFDGKQTIFQPYLDVSIVQLKTSIDAITNRRIKFACLPSNLDEAPPPEIILTGWGLKEEEKNTSLLRYVKLPTMFPCYDHHDAFCAMAAPGSADGTRPGDSGGGAVVYSSEIDNYVVHGITSKGSSDNEKRKSMLVKISYLLDDFCFYIGLCPSEEIRGLQPKLELNSIYLPLQKRSSMPSMTIPFAQISQDEGQVISDYCKTLRSEQQPSLDNCAVIPTNWDLIIESSTNAYVACHAALVTDHHAITTRDCLLRHMKQLKTNGNAQSTSVVVRQRTCSAAEACKTWTVALVAWSHSHPLALIQFQKAVDFNMMPVCFPADVWFVKSLEKIFREGSDKKITVKEWMDDYTTSPYALKPICSDKDFLCTKSIGLCGGDGGMREEKILKSGSAIINVEYGTVSGLKVDDRASYNDTTIELYWRTYQLLHALCLFLKRCDDDNYIFISNIPYFTHFYNINNNN